MLTPLRHRDFTFGLIEAVDEMSNCFTVRSLRIVEEVARLFARTFHESNREERYRAIFEGAPVALVGLDLSAVKGCIDLLSLPDGDGLLEYFDKNPDGAARFASMVVARDANKAAVDMYGAMTKRDLILNYRSVFAEESLDAFKSLLIALRGGQTHFHANTICRSLRGELKQLSLVWQVSPAHEKNWSRIICSVEDTTERTRAVDRLNEQLLFFQTLIDTVPTPIFYKDTEHRYLGCNKAFEAYSRTTKFDIVGKTVFDLLGDTRKAQIHHLADGELLRYPGKRLYESSIEHANGRRSTHIHRKATFIRHDGTSAGIVGVIMDISEQKVAEDRLRKSQEELRNLSRRLQYVREEERKAISREIHDQLGQTLTVLQMELALLARKIPSSEKSLTEKARQLKKRVREAIEIVRSISARTRPEMLDDLGLAAAIEWQVSEFRNLTGLSCTVTIDQADREIEADLSTALFRILQEALTNVWRHAHATDVHVSLRFQEDSLTLEVHDNGKGITERQANDSTSTGLIGMRERVYPWAGQVSIQGLSNFGTTVRVNVPLRVVGN
jgi:PAS domain S-box-containing protein